MSDYDGAAEWNRKLSIPKIIARKRLEAEVPYRFATLANRLAELGIDKREPEDWSAARLWS